MARPLDYPEAARVAHLWLVEFCDESLPYPDMIAEAARRASREIDSLQDELKLKTGEFDDASSVR